MNRLRTSKLARLLRAVTLTMALICLGISGGMTLGHTDDIGPLLSFHAGHSVLAHSAGDNGTSVACLACQWEDTTFDPHLPAVPILPQRLTLMPLPSALVKSCPLQSFNHTSPRAPPRDFS